MGRAARHRIGTRTQDAARSEPGVPAGVDDLGPASAVDLRALADSLLRSFDQLG